MKNIFKRRNLVYMACVLIMATFYSCGKDAVTLEDPGPSGSILTLYLSSGVTTTATFTIDIIGDEPCNNGYKRSYTAVGSTVTKDVVPPLKGSFTIKVKAVGVNTSGIYCAGRCSSPSVGDGKPVFVYSYHYHWTDGHTVDCSQVSTYWDAHSASVVQLDDCGC